MKRGRLTSGYISIELSSIVVRGFPSRKQNKMPLGQNCMRKMPKRRQWIRADGRWCIRQEWRHCLVLAGPSLYVFLGGFNDSTQVFSVSDEYTEKVWVWSAARVPRPPNVEAWHRLDEIMSAADAPAPACFLPVLFWAGILSRIFVPFFVCLLLRQPRFTVRDNTIEL